MMINIQSLRGVRQLPDDEAIPPNEITIVGQNPFAVLTNQHVNLSLRAICVNKSRGNLNIPLRLLSYGNFLAAFGGIVFTKAYND
ncbi:MAG TPA: hypothetical protein DCZ43_10915 [candidate division Zixibacteria bacterium]|jgi:hypothetical protein|nr:hypothetical protein [candidate division Zixibacteria bacterium]